MPTNWPTTHYYKRSLQTPTNRVTTHYYKKSLQTPTNANKLCNYKPTTNANKQIVNFFIVRDSPILRPDLWATLVPFVTVHNDNLNASPIIKFRTHNRAEYTEKRVKCCPTNIKRMQLQTYYKHLQTKPTNCKKVATNYKNVATNANKHLQTKPTNTQKVTTNANKHPKPSLQTL